MQKTKKFIKEIKENFLAKLNNKDFFQLKFERLKLVVFIT